MFQTLLQETARLIAGLSMTQSLTLLAIPSMLSIVYFAIDQVVDVTRLGERSGI